MSETVGNEMKRWTRNFDTGTNAIQPQIAVVVSSYNNPHALQLCLEGYRRQSFLQDARQQFHLILADDGSGAEVEQLFSNFADQISFPVTFIQQEHRGWGKPRMLNWAVLEARAEKIIFSDGDCVPRIHFVKKHWRCLEEKVVSCGRRVDLLEDVSRQLTVESVKSGMLDSPLWLLKRILKKQVDYGEQGFILPSGFAKIVQFFSTNVSPTILGSNFSVQKKWLFEVNGFDESFQTPGLGEDSDLERRLKRIGLKMKWITHQIVQFHLWHPLTVVGQESNKTFESFKKSRNTSAVRGIKELQEELKSSSFKIRTSPD